MLKDTEKGSQKSSTNDKESNFIIKNKIITKNKKDKIIVLIKLIKIIFNFWAI